MFPTGKQTLYSLWMSYPSYFYSPDFRAFRKPSGKISPFFCGPCISPVYLTCESRVFSISYFTKYKPPRTWTYTTTTYIIYICLCALKIICAEIQPSISTFNGECDTSILHSHILNFYHSF